MSVDVTISPPEGHDGSFLDDVGEPVVSFSNCRGNILTAPLLLGYDRLDQIDPSLAAKVLIQVIKELNKGNAGLFTDRWCSDASYSWDQHREMKEEYDKWESAIRVADSRKITLPFTDLDSYIGWVMRERIQGTARRFYFYYKSGYSVRFE